MNFSKSILKLISFAVLIAGSAIACTPTSNILTSNTFPSIAKEFNDKQIVVNFADQVVIPTYEKFTAKTKVLKTAASNLANYPTAANLKAAQTAWIEARVNWEQGESFTIGPAKSLGLDAAIDTWPLDQGDIQKVLNSNNQLTSDAVKKLQESQKGYHAIEFILFGANGKKAIADFTPREFEYLKAVAIVLDQDANTLLTAWIKGIDGQPAYREVFAEAGNNSIYPSLANAVQEMIEGIIDSTTEVAENKIAEPFTKKDPSLIESQYAIANPLNDIKNNILCVKNVYFGSLENHTAGKSGLSAYITKINPSLDALVDQRIEEALQAIVEIPSPFHTAISDPKAATKIKNAVAAVTKLKETFEQDIKPLLVES